MMTIRSLTLDKYQQLLGHFVEPVEPLGSFLLNRAFMHHGIAAQTTAFPGRMIPARSGFYTLAADKVHKPPKQL